MAKRRIPRETRLISEWLANEFPTIPHILNVRLGAIRPAIEVEDLTPEELAMLGVKRRRADAIILFPAKNVLVECKIVPDIDVIARLELMRELVRLTPELGNRRKLPVECWILTAVDSPLFEAYAHAKDIRVFIYSPPWARRYIAELAGRKRRPPVLEPEFITPKGGSKRLAHLTGGTRT